MVYYSLLFDRLLFFLLIVFFVVGYSGVRLFLSRVGVYCCDLLTIRIYNLLSMMLAYNKL